LINVSVTVGGVGGVVSLVEPDFLQLTTAINNTESKMILNLLIAAIYQSIRKNLKTCIMSANLFETLFPRSSLTKFLQLSKTTTWRVNLSNSTPQATDFQKLPNNQ